MDSKRAQRGLVVGRGGGRLSGEGRVASLYRNIEGITWTLRVLSI